MSEKRRPRRINPNKIVDGTIEIRFESELPSEIVLALIFNEMHEKWGKGEQSPVAQLPKALRDLRPELKYQPTQFWKLKEGRRLNVGPNMIALAANVVESGESFIAEFEQIVQRWELSKVLGKLTRVGIRYINLFENENIYENSTLKLELPGYDLPHSFPTLIRTELDREKFIGILQVVNKASVEHSGARTRSGSILDIDVVTKSDFLLHADLKFIAALLSEMHEVADKIFFATLREDYVATLNPEY